MSGQAIFGTNARAPSLTACEPRTVGGKPKSQPLDHRLLDRLMTESGHVTTSLGPLVGVDAGTVGRWRNGKHGPSGREAVLLARLFSITPWELYGMNPSRAEALAMRIDRLPAEARDRLFAEVEAWVSGAEAATPSLAVRRVPFADSVAESSGPSRATGAPSEDASPPATDARAALRKRRR
jgi:hypothetical protein